jgi:glycosyltransferase involved in cell wall biosynthesis
MKLLFVNYEYPPLGGGGGIAMQQVAEELATRHEIHVLTSGAQGMAATEQHPTRSLTIHRAPVFARSDRATASFRSMAAFVPSGIRVGKRLMRAVRFDAVNTWFAVPSGLTGGAIARRSNVPHVLTVIGGDIYDPSKWYAPHRFLPSGMAAKWALRHADKFVAISTDIAQRTREQFRFNSPIEIIPLGISEPQFRPATRESLGLSSDRRYIVTVGRLIRRKNYPTLLDAFRGLGRDDTSLLILGDGPERDSLQAQARRLGIADRVEFRGFVDEEVKYQLLANCDLFTLVSLHEGFGVVYLEAMYCGLPVVAADQGGQTDLLEDGLTGRLVPAGDATAIERSFRELLEDRSVRLRIGEHNRRRFQDFSIAGAAARYERIFELAIAASRGVVGTCS